MMDDEYKIDQLLNDKDSCDPQDQKDISSEAAQEPATPSGTLNDSMEEAIMYAKRYIEDLLSFFGLNTDVYATTEDGEVIELDIPSTHLNGFLIGSRGDTVRALQY